MAANTGGASPWQLQQGPQVGRSLGTSMTRRKSIEDTTHITHQPLGTLGVPIKTLKLARILANVSDIDRITREVKKYHDQSLLRANAEHSRHPSHC